MSVVEECRRELRSALHQYPNFPTQGVLFEDFMTIFQNPSLFKTLINTLKSHLNEEFPNGEIDYIVGIESRGFLFGQTLALAMDVGFVPIRKAGKLPGELVRADCEKEYGSATYELQKEAIPKGSNVVLIDDVLATGGSATAATQLLMSVGSNILEYCFLMELDFLKGKLKLNDAPVFSLLHTQEEGLKRSP